MATAALRTVQGGISQGFLRHTCGGRGPTAWPWQEGNEVGNLNTFLCGPQENLPSKSGRDYQATHDCAYAYPRSAWQLQTSEQGLGCLEIRSLASWLEHVLCLN
jgi:hypothetical protein